MNIHPSLKAFDLVSPYVKFATQYPKVLYSAMSNSKTRLLLLDALYMSATTGSYKLFDSYDNTDKFFDDSGFMKLNDNAYLYARSLNMYVPPVEYGEIGNISVWGNLDKMIFPFDIMPITLRD
jgi:hypothetical protein